VAFYLKEYERLLHDLKLVTDRKIITVSEAIRRISLGAPINDTIILRHDVDRKPSKAEAMALLEHRLSVRSTYYFRCNKAGQFPAAAVKRIVLLGHEVGYHYECLSRCNGRSKEALAQFSQHLTAFRAIAPCTTVSMHGAPLSSRHNQYLLKNQNITKYGLDGDAVLSLDDMMLAYLTDTGGQWQADDSCNLRDRIGIFTEAFPNASCSSFIPWLQTFPHSLYITVHPERWVESKPAFIEATARDILANQAKRTIKFMHRMSGRDSEL